MEGTQAPQQMTPPAAGAPAPRAGQAVQAVILAAGKGSRLGNAADGLPKCLIQVGGQPLIRRQLDALAEAGVSPVTVVIGYAADLVRESVGNAAEFVLNARYDATNSLHSFFLARDRVRGAAVVLNSDVLFDPRVLETLLKAGEDSLAYDSTSGYAREHMKVATRKGRVTDLSKELPVEETSGENVGMLYLSRRTLDLVFAEAERRVAAGRTNAFLAEAIRACLGEVDLKAVDIAGVPWTEIDTPHDLERARKELWPKISDHCAAGWKRRRRWRRMAWSLGAGVALLLAFSAAWTLAPRRAPSGWETVAAPHAQTVTLSIGGIAQPWWRVEGDETVGTEIEGPRSVRIDLRCVTSPGTWDKLPYVAEVLIDGKRQAWDHFKAVADPHAHFPDLVVCDRQKMDVQVPAGTHSVAVRLLAGDPKALLVRFRVIGLAEE